MSRLSDIRWASDLMEGPLRCYDTDANYFRDLLNCEAVREWVAEIAGVELLRRSTLLDRVKREFWYDQPAALRRLREAMEARR